MLCVTSSESSDYSVTSDEELFTDDSVYYMSSFNYSWIVVKPLEVTKEPYTVSGTFLLYH